ncbi:MAG: RagB/SusD family nutrient uptake outer membrane protein, partial [Prevotella sp.]
AFATCLMASCNDWLDVNPSTEVDKSQIISSEAGFADALSGVYVNMTSDELYGKNLTWYGVELMGGGTNVMYGNNMSYQSFSFHPDADSYYESLRLSFTDQIWNKQYNTIANVNSLLASIDEAKGIFIAGDYEVMKGELLGLRAFLHFDLLRLFADAYGSDAYSAQKTYIPYVTEITSQVHPLLTNDQVCELILDDLKQAKELLKLDPMATQETPSEYVCSKVTGQASARTKYNIKEWHNRRFHFNYYAALATMARVYLWKGDKTEALACAKEIIADAPTVFPWVSGDLVSNVASTDDYVARDRTFSTEQIFALNIKDMEDRTDGYLMEKTTKFTTDMNIIGFNTDVFDNATQQYDIRYAYLKNVYSIYGNEFYVSNKYVKDNDPNNYSPWSANRVPLIRLAEMYYIAAECEPDLAKATEYLNTVRAHRGLEAYPISVTSRDELQEQIRLEYHKETIGEGQTFYYYKRLGKTIVNKSMAAGETHVSQELFTMPRPDDEDAYGGRN